MEQNKKTIPNGKKKKKVIKKHNKNKFSIHLIFFILIIAVFLFAVIKFLLWNKGEASDYDPNETTTEFDIETMDYIQTMDSSRFEGIEDDGITTMLCLGNSPFSDNKGEDGLAQTLAKKMNGIAYDGSFANSYQTSLNYHYDPSYPMDAFSLYRVAEAICTGDFSLQESAATDEVQAETIHTLKSLDYSKIDMLVIMYDLNDYIAKRALHNPVMNDDIGAWTGSLNATLNLLETTFPHIRTVVLSAPACGMTIDGTYIDADTTDFGNGTLPDYIGLQMGTAMTNGVSFIDLYYGVINSETKDEYLTDDYHLNEKGIQAIADRFYYFFGNL